MKAILLKSLGVSDSEIQGVRDVMVNSEEMNAGQRPTPGGGQDWISESDTPKDFGNITSILSLGFRFP